MCPRDQQRDSSWQPSCVDHHAPQPCNQRKACTAAESVSQKPDVPIQRMKQPTTAWQILALALAFFEVEVWLHIDESVFQSDGWCFCNSHFTTLLYVENRG